MWDLSSELLKLDVLDSQRDVPSALRYGAKKERPLGRYLQQKLRVMCGKDEKAPRNFEREAEMLDLLTRTIQNAKNKEGPLSIKKLIQADSEGEVNQTVTRWQIHHQRKRL